MDFQIPRNFLHRFQCSNPSKMPKVRKSESPAGRPGTASQKKYLYKSYAVRLGGVALLQVEDPLPAACALPADCAKPTISLELSAKPTILGSWRPRRPADGPPGAQDGLQTGFLARKTASDGPPAAPDGFRMGLLAPQTACPPGALVGLWTGLLTPQTASDGPSPADKFTCRQDHLPTSPPASQVSSGAKRAFDACTFLPLTPYCRDSVRPFFFLSFFVTRRLPRRLGCKSTVLHIHLLSSHYATGTH